MRSILSEFVILPKTADRDGLRSGRMTNLPAIVAITGPNGAGKTRLLNRINSNLELRPYTSHVVSHAKNISQLEPKEQDFFDAKLPLNHAEINLLFNAANQTGYTHVESLSNRPKLFEGCVTTTMKPRLILIDSRPKDMASVGTTHLNEFSTVHIVARVPSW